MTRVLSVLVAAFLLMSCNAEESSSSTETAPVTENKTETPKTAEPKKETPVKKEEKKPETKAEPKKVSTEPIIITDANFEQLVLKSDKVVLIDFWAVWCGPCKRIAPIIKELAAEYAGKAVIAKLDVDKNQAVAAKYQINSIPTILIFKNGQPVDGAVGAHPKATLKSKLDKALGS